MHLPNPPTSRSCHLEHNQPCMEHSIHHTPGYRSVHTQSRDFDLLAFVMHSNSGEHEDVVLGFRLASVVFYASATVVFAFSVQVDPKDEIPCPGVLALARV
jgi:hypothetical protein